jgi:hypothetical protein
MESTLTGAEYKTAKSLLEEYVERLGRLQTALHTLEFWLRRYLFRAEGPHPTVNINAIKIGDKVPVTALTDFASLRELIARYNATVDPRAVIGPSVVELRNALAHARVFSPTGQPPFRLLRFAKPDGGLAEVENVVDNLDAKWFEVQTTLVESETKNVFVLSALELWESAVNRGTK